MIEKKEKKPVNKKMLYKVFGVTFLVCGIALIILGIVDFAMASANGGKPYSFWAIFVGVPLFGIGIMLCIPGFAKPFPEEDKLPKEEKIEESKEVKLDDPNPIETQNDTPNDN